MDWARRRLPPPPPLMEWPALLALTSEYHLHNRYLKFQRTVNCGTLSNQPSILLFKATLAKPPIRSTHFLNSTPSSASRSRPYTPNILRCRARPHRIWLLTTRKLPTTYRMGLGLVGCRWIRGRGEMNWISQALWRRICLDSPTMEWESAGRRSFRVGMLKFTRSVYHRGVLVWIRTVATKSHEAC